MRRWTTWDWKSDPQAPHAWADAGKRLVEVEPDFWAPHGFERVDAHCQAWWAMQKSQAVFVVPTRHVHTIPSQALVPAGDRVALAPAHLSPNIIPALRATTQAELDAGLATLLAVRAACRALWLEPQEGIELGPDLEATCPAPRLLCHRCAGAGRVARGIIDAFGGEGHVECSTCRGSGGLDWVVCRGTDAPVHSAWVERIRHACRAAEVPFSFLGWGDWQVGSTLGRELDIERVLLSTGRLLLPHRVQEDTTADERCDWPLMRAEMVARVGAERSGCLIDGKVVDERPEIAR